MHEAAIAQAILEKSCKLTNEPISEIYINVGEFRNVDFASLSFAFDSLKTEYDFTQQATLVIKAIALKAYCASNNHEYYPKQETCYCCPFCQAGIGKLIAGNELDIIKLTCC